jgi:hypothetical protein
MKKIAVVIIVMSMIAGSTLFSGCVQQQRQGNRVKLGSGTLRFFITDAPANYTILHANVTISQIQVHISGPTREAVGSSRGGTFDVNANGPYKAHAGETIQFRGNASGGKEPYSWSWDFGDGHDSSLQNPQYSYSVKGAYKVNLTVTDGYGATAWHQTNVYIDLDEENSELGWVTITNDSKTFDLIALKNVTDLLAEKNLTTGNYTQIRLAIESAMITISTNGLIKQHSLQVPSEKIRLIHKITITTNVTTEITLDFGADTSIHQTGNGEFILYPNITVVQG